MFIEEKAKQIEYTYKNVIGWDNDWPFNIFSY